MGQININGKTYKGDNLRIENNKVYIDGKLTEDTTDTLNTEKSTFRQMLANVLNVPKNLLMRIEVSGIVSMTANNSTLNILGDVTVTEDGAFNKCDVTCNVLTSERDLVCNDISADELTINAKSVITNEINCNDVKTDNLSVDGDMNCDSITAHDITVSGDMNCDNIDADTVKVSGELNCDDITGDVEAAEINAGTIYRTNGKSI